MRVPSRPSGDEVLWGLLAGSACAIAGAILVYAVLLALPPISLTRSWPLLLIVGGVAAVAEVIAAGPTAAALRFAPARWRLPMLATIAAGVPVALLVGIPPLFAGWRDLDATTWLDGLSAAVVFGVASLLKAAALGRPAIACMAEPSGRTGPPTKRQAAMAFVVALALLGTGSVVWPAWTVFWREPEHVEAYLLGETPAGSSAAVVLEHLDRRGLTARLNRHPLEPEAWRYRAEDPGAASIHVAVASYRVIFRVAVEATYVFDDTDRLKDIRVRTTVDAI